MEGKKHYQPEIAPEIKEEQEVRPILDSSLSGKTKAELTPEQQEAEIDFEMKNLESFLEQIEKEEVMAHGTHNLIAPILALGIKSHTQRLGGIKDPELEKMAQDSFIGDPIWQWQTQEFLLKKIILPYAQLLTEEPDVNMLIQKKEELLKKLPKIGKKRVEWFLDNTVPKFIEAGLDPHDFEYVFPFNGGGSRDHMNEFRFNAKSLQNDDLLLENLKDIKEEHEYKKTLSSAMWMKLSKIIGGEDLISSTPAKYLKQKFTEVDPNKPSGFLTHYDGVVIYFDNPQEIRMYNLGHASYTNDGERKWQDEEYDSDDIGVSSTVTPSNFKVIRFGNYDRDNRTLYLPKNVRLDDVVRLVKLQNKGVLFFDESLVGLPPLESIKVIDPGYEMIPNNGLMIRVHNPTAEQKLMYEYIDKVKNKNNTDSYKRISGIIKEKRYNWGKSEKDAK